MRKKNKWNIDHEVAMHNPGYSSNKRESFWDIKSKSATVEMTRCYGISIHNLSICALANMTWGPLWVSSHIRMSNALESYITLSASVNPQHSKQPKHNSQLATAAYGQIKATQTPHGMSGNMKSASSANDAVDPESLCWPDSNRQKQTNSVHVM